MRILKNVLIDGEAVELQSENLLLELSNVGRGFITVRTENDCTGKSVLFELGEFDHYFKWFSGFVEEEQPAERGYKRLFIRENVAKLEKPLSVSLRHCTLRDICDFVQSKTGLQIETPQASYVTTPIPLCTHAGNGLQLLNNLGRMFQIPEYFWQQNADNVIFVGGWNESQYKDENVEIAERESLSQGSNFLTIPINAGIKPACSVNGKRITKVRLQGQKYELEWQNEGNSKSPERLKMEQEYPEFAGGYHLSKYGKIIAIADPSNAGDIVDPFRPKYAVDVQLLDENGNEDSETPVFPAVPLPVPATASQGGEFAFPEIGTVVEIGFMYGRSDMPIIRNFFPFGKTIPSVGIGELLKQQRPEVFERIDAAGNRLIETDQTISEKSFVREIETDSEKRTIGQSEISVESNKSQSIGGNYQLQALGNIESTTAADYIVGVGGNLQQRIAGVASLLSQTKAEIQAPITEINSPTINATGQAINLNAPAVAISGSAINIGNGNANVLKILEELLQIVADLATQSANHTHSGTGTPQQEASFNGLSAKARAEKGKLSPMIG